jgi:phosphate-selective porin OprO/OprP
MIGTIAVPQPFSLAAAAVLVLAAWAPGQASAQSTEERIRQLEEQLKAVSEELKALKEQVAAPAPSAGTGEQAPVRAQPAPTPAAGQAETASDAARRAETEAAAANEKGDKLEQQMDRVWTRTPEGIGWQSADGRWQAQLFGRLQFDYRTYQPGGMVPDGFSIRRIRLGAGVTYDKYYTFVLEGEYATGNASTTTPQTANLVNGYLLLDWFRPEARIYLGQFKPQFGLENTGSDNLTDFTERSLQYSFLQNLTYDRGVMVTGTPEALPGLNYGVAVTNGTGTNTEEQAGNAQAVSADGKMLTARLTENFAALLKQPRNVYHLGLNYKSGSAANSSSSPYTAASIQTEGRGVVFFTPQAFNAATGVTATNVDRTLTAYELALAFGPLKLQSEYWTANYSGTRQSPAPVTPYDLDLSAYYLEMMWMVTGENYADWYRGGQFGRIRPRNNFNWRARTWGAWQVGVRYSQFDGNQFSLTAPANAGRLATNAPTTLPTNQASAWTLGATWVLNPYVRFLVNYIHTDFDMPITVNAVATDHQDALVFRAQIDF